ncbi:MAG: magnesium/cobalt transporter CorA [Flavobacteriales bacterium]|nr:magnesium/cobalt transporter CorA [Flavobacteriales bacterium]MCC6938960.1 magnesium/cobalt transporter CorA [Flavobacteriales bacterium]
MVPPDLKEKNEIGMSPYQLHFRGEKRTDRVHLRLIDYGPETLQERELDSVDDVLALKDSPTVSWLNVDGVHDAKTMEAIARGLGFETLILADAMNTRSRPKIAEYANCLFVSIKMLREEDASEELKVEHLSLVVTEHMLISFQEEMGDVFNPVRERIRAQKKRIRGSGPDYLMFALLDIVVDNYIYIIGKLGDKIEDLEDGLLEDPSKTVIEEINAYKRELNNLRKNILPAREVILNLSKLDSEFIDEEKNAVHFRELVDNINQAAEATSNYREILSDQLTIYHTTISSKLNDIMKFLTVFSVIFIPLTFIAGIYGTNFDVLPELHFRYSYYVMWGIMISVAVGMLVYFKRNKWL